MGMGKDEIVYADFERDDLVMIDFTISSSDTSEITSILNTLNTGLKIYPIPTSNTLQIDLINKNIYLKTITVVNLHGQEILNEHAGSKKKFKIDLSGLSSGTYYLKLQTSHGEIIQRLLKQ